MVSVEVGATGGMGPKAAPAKQRRVAPYSSNTHVHALDALGTAARPCYRLSPFTPFVASYFGSPEHCLVNASATRPAKTPPCTRSNGARCVSFGLYLISDDPFTRRCGTARHDTHPQETANGVEGNDDDAGEETESEAEAHRPDAEVSVSPHDGGWVVRDWYLYVVERPSVFFFQAPNVSTVQACEYK